MIASFKCKQTEELWATGKCKRFPPDALKAALRKLLMVHNAAELKDLRTPPKQSSRKFVGKQTGTMQHQNKSKMAFMFCLEK